ncbi:hypothetical protein B6A10_15305 [Flavobacterium sp. L1I52]|uniref:PL28 ulvan lyase domain-containing protein n=1 Tax=Flavobacterium pokkalii TaxID=1940408 RepID=A0ABR7UUD2_9FLAO|nr:hypothetical protein [Flavobacterium pokkalii]MBD0726539.1 hypothetical protein [Flavobacterium pokkalii]
MKTKFKQLALGGFGGLLQIGLLMSCTNDVQETNNVAASDEEVVVPVSNNLTALSCSQVLYTWTGGGTDHNVGVNATIDDRSCTYDYTQGTYGSQYDWGVYRLLSTDDVGSLQTRIERASSTVNNIKSGNYVRITGYCRVLEAGTFTDSHPPTSMSDKDGTYLIQAKGTHTGGGGSADPAIALFIAKPVRDSNGNVILNGQGKTDSFDIYREEILSRGGSGTTGRQLVFITNVKYNTDFWIDVSTGFDTVNGNLRHYVKSTINGVSSTFTVPEPERALQAKLRMGAYRCHGGSATILWRKGTTQANFVNNP